MDPANNAIKNFSKTLGSRGFRRFSPDNIANELLEVEICISSGERTLSRDYGADATNIEIYARPDEEYIRFVQIAPIRSRAAIAYSEVKVSGERPGHKTLYGIVGENGRLSSEHVSTPVIMAELFSEKIPA